MKKILISADAWETRVAVVEDGVVVETMVDRPERKSLLGNCYLALVDNVLPGMEAAFVDAGLAKNAFLYVSDIILPELEGKPRRERRIESMIRNGQKLLVQVVKDPMGTKGARVTMELSFAGRFLVYAPDSDGHGVSKSLPDKERDRLRVLVKQLQPKHRAGLIVRTAARGATLEELERDLELLEAQWEEIQARVKTAKAPSLAHGEADLALQMIRDELRVDVDEVIVDDEATYERIREYVEARSPDYLPRIKLHRQAVPLLRRFQVEEAIRSTLDRRVDLPSGGYLLVDYAEAFTIIDVNTGRFVGKARLEDTILHNNLEAAREVARQLRLRDIGGMIVIDFVDMAAKKNRDAVIAALQKELEKDRAKVYVVSISPLGLVEMTRENVTDGVREILTEKCPTCRGEGRTLSDETIAIENLRHLRRHARLSTNDAFLVELNPDVATRMIGQGGSRLAQLETETAKHFSLVGVDGAPRERCAVVKEGPAEAILEEAVPVSVGQELEVELSAPHMYQAADAVHLLESGFPIVVSGGGAYVGETHTVRVAHVGRFEASAELLSARPVTEEEMLAQLDPRSDVQEPQRQVMERIDLEDRDRRRRTPRKKEAAGKDAPKPEQRSPQPQKSAAADKADAAEEPAADGRKRRRRSRRGRAGDELGVNGAVDAETTLDGAAGDDEGAADEVSEAAVEADAGDGAEETTNGEPRRRRRGRRGGRRHRRGDGETVGVDGASDGGGEPAAAEAAVAAGVEAPAEPTEQARPRRTRRRVADPASSEAAAPVAPAAEAAAAAPADDAPAPARRSRRRTPAVTAAAEAPAVESPAAEPAASESPATPARRTRRTAASAAPAEAAVVVEPAAPAETAATPARRTRRRTTPGEAATPVEPAAPPTAEAPATPVRRTRRAAAAPAEAVAVAEAAPIAAAPPTAAPRRRTRSTAASAVEAPAGVAPAPAAATAVPAEATPAAPRRRTRRPAAEPTTE